MVAGGRVLRSTFPQTGKAPFRRQDRVSQPKHLVLVSLTLVKTVPHTKGRNHLVSITPHVPRRTGEAAFKSPGNAPVPSQPW
jgi:hypothetical protein